MKVIVISTQKGGNGKSTTAVNLAAALALAGARVGCVDCEPQAHFGKCLGVEVQTVAPARSVGKMILDETLGVAWTRQQILDALYDVENAILPGKYDISGSIHLFGSELNTLVSAERQISSIGNSAIASLRRILLRVEEDFDYIVIDTPPTTQSLCQVGLAAADHVIAPCMPKWLSIGGVTVIRSLASTINEITKGECNPQYLGVVNNDTSPPSKMAAEEILIRNALVNGFDPDGKAAGLPRQRPRVKKSRVDLYPSVTEIRHDVRISDAANDGVPAVVSAVNYAPGKAYLALMEEVLTRMDTPEQQWPIADAFDIGTVDDEAEVNV